MEYFSRIPPPEPLSAKGRTAAPSVEPLAKGHRYTVYVTRDTTLWEGGGVSSTGKSQLRRPDRGARSIGFRCEIHFNSYLALISVLMFLDLCRSLRHLTTGQVFGPPAFLFIRGLISEAAHGQVAGNARFSRRASSS